jgi:hypothetical protein
LFILFLYFLNDGPSVSVKKITAAKMDTNNKILTVTDFYTGKVLKFETGLKPGMVTQADIHYLPPATTAASTK